MSARQLLCAHYYDCAPSRSEFRSEFLGELLSSLLRQVVSFCLWQTEEQEIRAFFERLDLGRFVQGILNAGYTTFESLCSLSAQKLHAELGFPVKLAHRAHEELEKRKSGAGTQFTSFTRTKVHILTQKALQTSVRTPCAVMWASRTSATGLKRPRLANSDALRDALHAGGRRIVMCLEP